MDNEFDGSQRQAARALARPGDTKRQPENLHRRIARLARGEIGAITEHTAQVLLELVGPERQDELRQMMLTPAARVRLVRYRRWIRRELARTPGTDHLERRLRRRHRELFEDFDRFLERKGYTAPRAELAYRHVLAPLTQDAVSGRVERGATDLSPAEVRRYLKHAFGAQRVLLDRPTDTTRAMHAARSVEVRELGTQQVRERERRTTTVDGTAVADARRPLRLGRRVTGTGLREE